jgi:hypothetical protein
MNAPLRCGLLELHTLVDWIGVEKVYEGGNLGRAGSIGAMCSLKRESRYDLLYTSMARSTTCPEGLTHTVKLEGFFFFALVLISLSRDSGTSIGAVFRNRFNSLRFLKCCIVMILLHERIRVPVVPPPDTDLFKRVSITRPRARDKPRFFPR